MEKKSLHRGMGNLFAIESGGNNPIDFTHNSWYPNREARWTNTGGSYASITAAYAGLPATSPVFSGSTKRHEADNIAEANPFTTTITLGSDYHTQTTTLYTPTLTSGTAPKNTGTPIIGITDGYSGSAPDRGALISGLPVPAWGDRSGTVQPSTGPGDLNTDRTVNIIDLNLVVADFGKTSGFNPVVDTATPFGTINLFDVMTVVTNWGKNY